MDFLFIVCLFFLLMVSLIFAYSLPMQKIRSMQDFISNLKSNLDYSLQTLNWYPVTDKRQYLILIFGIVLGYLLG